MVYSTKNNLHNWVCIMIVFIVEWNAFKAHIEWPFIKLSTYMAKIFFVN